MDRLAAAPTLREAVDLLHTWYPPGTAETWDRVGLVAGDPDQPVARIALAVDATLEVAQEAAAWGADLLVVHHPLFLKGVHSVARTTPKGRTLGVLTDAGCALLAAHTNADRAVGGVSEALARAIGLTEIEALQPSAGPALDKITVFVPVAAAEAVRAALAGAGAGRIGDYDSASFTSPGEGRFRPLPGARPFIGEVGRAEVVPEVRIEAVLERSRRTAVVSALLAAHPYEEPAYDVVSLADLGDPTTGTARVGWVQETTLARFADHVARVLPLTSHGVRAAGDPHRPVRRVAVCGGAGDFLLDDLATGLGGGPAPVDVYLTSDLRHHPASEFVEKNGPALVDVAHWAAEWTWLPVLAERLAQVWGDTVETRVSALCTDPWTFRI